MYEITNRTQAPYSSICYIECEWADGSMTRASGVVIGVNDVLTAHHVVFDATRGGYATHITISPGADTSPRQSPYGTFSDVGVIYARTADWDPSGDGLLYPAESQYDMAVLGLRSAIGNVSGWVGVASAAGDFSGTVDGYPASGSGLMEERVFADASSDYGVYDIAASLGPGASGGPLLRTDADGTRVVGVLSSGNSTHSTYAGLFGQDTWGWLQGALSANDNVMPGGVPASGPLSPTSAGVITYLGTLGPDSIAGSAANESFRGSEGNDAMDGGGGSDTALYTGVRADYSMAAISAGVRVADSRMARDGSDNLGHMEHVQFSDMNVNLGIGATSRSIGPAPLQVLEELYVAFFNRVPEADGLAFWIGRVAAGQPLAEIADAFYAAAQLYPAQTHYYAGMTSGDFVDVIYRNVLGRTEGADPEGLAYWTHQLDSGAQGRGSLVSTILATAHSLAGDPNYGWVSDLLDNKAAVAQRFAVEMGLGYNTAEASISHGMQIAAAVTATDTSAAIALIGVHDGFSTLA